MEAHTVRFPAIVLLIAAVVLLCAQIAPATVVDGSPEALFRGGSWLEAAVRAEEALTASEKASGAGSLDTASRLDFLGAVYCALWRCDDAEAMYGRALAIKEAKGAPPLEIAATLQGLAQVCAARGRYSDFLDNMGLQSFYHARWQFSRALPLLQCVLQARESALGAEDVAVAETLNAMGDLRRARIEFTEAEKCLTRARALRESACGVESPEAAESLNSLGKLYYSQLKFPEAMECYHQALAIREKSLGPAHPLTAQTLNELGQLHSALAEFGKAEPLLRRSLAIREKSLGLHHPDVAVTLGDLAELARGRGALEAAEPLTARARDLWVELFGADSPHAAVYGERLAQIFAARKKYPEALVQYRRALSIWERLLGPDDPYLATVLEEMVAAARKAGAHDEVKALEERLRRIREQNR